MADDRKCTLCWAGEEEGPLIKACNCQDIYYHYQCLLPTIESSRDSPCVSCKTPYKDKRIVRVVDTHTLPQHLMERSAYRDDPILPIAIGMFVFGNLINLLAASTSENYVQRSINGVMLIILITAFWYHARESHQRCLDRRGRDYYPRYFTKFREYPGTGGEKVIDYTDDVRHRQMIEPQIAEQEKQRLQRVRERELEEQHRQEELRGKPDARQQSAQPAPSHQPRRRRRPQWMWTAQGPQDESSDSESD